MILESYKQTTNYTGAASALLSILHYFDATIEFSQENELDIWLKSAILPTRASSVFGLAMYAKEKGLQPKIIIEDASYTYPDYRFKRYTKKQIELAEKIANRYKKQAEEDGILIVEKDFDVNYIDSLLAKEKILLIRVNAGRLRGTKSTSKYIVIYKKSATDSNQYFIIDPRRRRKKITREMLEESLEELKTKKKREKCMVVF
ncbi:peptidase C39 family protein [Candidatus Woesearchaeota archaeon]|nr:peptidase C39 family protein [Candidatus Woesearchaeota archaeon]